MRVTIPGVAVGAIIGAVLVLGVDKIDGYGLRQHPAEQNRTAEVVNAPTGGPRAAPQSAGDVQNTGGGRQTKPATAVRQDQEQKAPEGGAKVPEQGPVKSATGTEPKGAPSRAASPGPQQASSAPPAAPRQQ